MGLGTGFPQKRGTLKTTQHQDALLWYTQWHKFIGEMLF